MTTHFHLQPRLRTSAVLQLLHCMALTHRDNFTFYLFIIRPHTRNVNFNFTSFSASESSCKNFWQTVRKHLKQNDRNKMPNMTELRNAQNLYKNELHCNGSQLCTRPTDSQFIIMSKYPTVRHYTQLVPRSSRLHDIYLSEWIRHYPPIYGKPW
jgi:hypothetical protein